MNNFKSFLLIIATLFLTSAFATDIVKPITPALPKITAQPIATPGDEPVFLDQLIAATQENLEKQKALREKLREYLQLRDQYAKQTQNKELSMRLVKVAYSVLEGITDQHLAHLFDPAFMSELTFFSNIAAKQKTPK